LLALDAFIRFIFYCRPSRSIALGNDLLDLFKDGGTDDGEMNIKYAALLNIISCDESCVYRLLDQGILKMLVSLQEAFNKLCAQLNLSNSSAQKKKQFIRRHRQNKGGTQGSLKLEGGNSASGGGTMGVTGGEAGDAGDDAASQSQSGISLNGSDEGPVTGNKLGEWGRELTAAIFAQPGAEATLFGSWRAAMHHVTRSQLQDDTRAACRAVPCMYFQSPEVKSCAE
jgi:hypothetical protein